MLRNLLIYSGLIFLFMAGCSTYSSNPLRTSYHNLTAHFNAYFIAAETMKEIEATVYNDYQWNYNKILPIYPQIDSNQVNSMSALLEDVIEKSSIAIQRHEGSKWEDDSYILVGKARYYSLEYADAIETFKYVNKHSEDEDARHRALVELTKTFVDFNEINNAIAVSDFVKKEKLNKRNRQQLNLVRAYLYQKRNDLDQMVQHLVKAEETMSRSADKARINFIIGQIYQQLGFDAEAYFFYENVLRNSPEYELEFYTKLNMAQVTQLTSSGEVKKVRKYFRKLLRDTKNIDYKDKIYYEMAAFELKQGNLEEAIDYYKSSIRFSLKNQRQKAYSYLRLGQIYYDSLKQFELAKNYYDSTVTTMPRDEENYEKIKQRQEVLEDFVKQITTIRKNDSLIVISQLPIDSLTALATQVVEDREAKAEQKKKREERRQANMANSRFDTNTGDLIGTGLSGSIWYFYNPSALSQGMSEFKRVWGNRPLEDNWRRSLKSSSDLSAQNEEAMTEAAKETDELPKDDRIANEVKAMLAAVPASQEQIDKLLAEVEVAHYHLGNIYNFKLEENQNAIETFETLVVRFPESEYLPEVLYQLYLLYKEHDQPMAADRANELKTRFPDSIYAKLVDNPNYREESNLATEQLKIAYTKAYRLYDQGKYQESRYMLDSALRVHPENDFSDNLMLLKVLAIGQLEGQIKYQYELNNFIKNYPDSDLLTYAQNLVKASEDYQINLYNSAKAKFVEHFKQNHYLIVVYPNKEALAQNIPPQVEAFIKNKNFGLTVGNLILNQSQAMVLVNEFPGKSSAEKFLTMFKTDLDLNEFNKGEKIYSFVITEDNFEIFYQTKDLNAYLNFFEKHYQQ